MPTISVPGHGDVEFPDSMSEADITTALRKIAPPPVQPPSTAAAVKAGMTQGFGDRLIARAQAMRAQQGQGDPANPMQSLDAITSKSVDEPRFESDRARILQERRDTGAAANAAHPVAHIAGQMLPAAASMLIPGAGSVKGAAAIGGALGLTGSESDDPLRVGAEGATGAALSGAGATFLRLLARPVNAVGDALLPRAEAIRDRLMSAIGDRSASAADATAKAAQGTAGATTANASRLLERLGMRNALPASEVAANEAASATPEAQALATRLAGKARADLPDKLSQVEGAQALMEQTAADAANARSPEAVAAMEKQMRGEIADRLLKRYLLPAAVGAAADKARGGSGELGAIAGFGMRPMMRAVGRGVTSPAFTAPLSRALVSGAEGLSTMGAEIPAHLAPLLEGTEPKLLDLLRSLIAAPPPPLAQQP